ncbi:hypothetical protein [Kitasatospora sp. NPDC017646]|uniref:hypothetical protein n=1 Tax=Kitasatospora sp. NPDC017646 TaxID=3364024 RepID=UPI0037AAAB81
MCAGLTWGVRVAEEGSEAVVEGQFVVGDDDEVRAGADDRADECGVGRCLPGGADAEGLHFTLGEAELFGCDADPQLSFQVEGVVDQDGFGPAVAQGGERGGEALDGTAAAGAAGQEPLGVGLVAGGQAAAEQAGEFVLHERAFGIGVPAVAVDGDDALA